MTADGKLHRGGPSAWPAMLISPLVALGQGSLAYALVTPACARQAGWGLHALTALSLAVALVLTLAAWRRERRLAFDAPIADDLAGGGSRPLFIARSGLLIGVLSCVTIVAMWAPLWWLPPCS